MSAVRRFFKDFTIGAAVLMSLAMVYLFIAEAVDAILYGATWHTAYMLLAVLNLAVSVNFLRREVFA